MKQYYIWKSSPSASVDYRDVPGVSYSWDNTHLVGVSSEDEVLFLLKEKSTYSIHAHAVIERVDEKIPSQEYLENVPGHAHRTRLVYTAYYRSYKKFPTPIELISAREEGRNNRRELGLTNMLSFGVSMKRVTSEFFHKCLELASKYESKIDNPSSVAITIAGDSRQAVMRQIRERRGQQAFRQTLRTRYGDQCMISGCQLLDVIEAAHILPYRGEANNHPENGLLLRADLHTLFDLDLLGIHPKSLKVQFHPAARAAGYHEWEGKILLCSNPRPSQTALESRWQLFQMRLQDEI